MKIRELLILIVAYIVQCHSFMIPDVKKTVKSALDEARLNLANVREVTTSAQVQSQKPNSESLEWQKMGKWMHEATRIVVKQNGSGILSKIDNDEVRSMVEMRRRTKRTKRNAKEEEKNCVKDDTNCKSQKNFLYRSITGVCNHIEKPSEGAAVTPLARLLGSAFYDDGMGSLRRSILNEELPSARQISNSLDLSTPSAAFDSSLNNLQMQFGQIIAHDLVFIPSSTGENGEMLDCKSCNAGPNCAPIEVPMDDPYFPRSTSDEKKCIQVTRALNGQQGFGVREQLDQDTNCKSKDPYFCFQCGDFRSSLHPGLGPLHTMWILEHNRIAREIIQRKPSLSDEIVYQTARRLVIAEYQHIVYNEYLPIVLGERIMRDFKLKPLMSGRTKYDPTTSATVTGEFGAGAFRFGHSQTRRDFPRVSVFNRTLAPGADIGNNIFYAEAQYKDGGAASFIAGMLYYPQMRVDTSFSFPMRNQIFEIRNQPASGVDLFALNIQRGRDVGFHPYVDYREAAGLPAASEFSDLVSEMGEDKVEQLKKLYKHVRDIDLYVGILSENHLPGAIIGPTGAYIIAEQFLATKLGDRFYYEHEPEEAVRGLTDGELAEIRKSSLGGVICGAFESSFSIVPEDIFKFNSKMINCSSIYIPNTSEFVKTE